MGEPMMGQRPCTYYEIDKGRRVSEVCRWDRNMRKGAGGVRGVAGEEGVLVRFEGVCGALVVVVETRVANGFEYRYECCGCLEGMGNERKAGSALDRARRGANTHASECRALPRIEDGEEG